MYKFGFIGTGNMGSAIAKAAVKAVGKESIMLSNRTEEKAKILQTALAVNTGQMKKQQKTANIFFLVLNRR